jgi:Protein of unknown function (DUF1822)
MTFDSALFDSIQLCLQIDSATQTQAWQDSQAFATPTSQWNAYLNQLCLQTLLPCLQEDLPRAAAPNRVALSSQWELVNGSAIAWADRRLALIPTETIDLEEIRIPQEWVDIPTWAADYYLAVQVNPDQAWVRVAGFISHRQLKQQAQLDSSDRTYCLDGSDLIPDLSVLWVTQQLHTPEPTRASLPALSTLSTAEAHHLIERLGNPAIPNPRLAIPFARWAALLAHGGWRQRLVEQRRGIPEQRSPLQWLQSGLTTFVAGWGRVDYQPATATARSTEASNPVAALSRPLTIAGQPYELRIMPVDLTANIWRFELTSLTASGLIPTGFILRLLTEDLRPFSGNEDTATSPTDQLYIEVALEPGEALVWEVEPMPAAYDQEILRF